MTLLPQLERELLDAHDRHYSPDRRGRASRSRWSARSRRWLAGGGSVFALAVGGGGIAYATGAWSPLPGGDAVSELARPVAATGSGTQTIELGPRPAGANAVTITLRCLSAGTFWFPDGSSESCDKGGPRAPLTSGRVSLASGQDSIKITTTAGARWRLTATYVSATTTPWAVNASGQTYGVANQHGTPDLVAATATNHKSGYVYANQLMEPPPKSPKQAIARQKAEQNAPPRVLTVYRSDGKTPIGKFVLSKPTGG